MIVIATWLIFSLSSFYSGYRVNMDLFTTAVHRTLCTERKYCFTINRVNIYSSQEIVNRVPFYARAAVNL